MTLRDIIKDALRCIGIIQPGEEPTQAQMNAALPAVQSLIDSWSNDRLLIHKVQPFYFPVQAGKDTYTLGPDGDWNTTRPMSVLKAKWLLPEGNNAPWPTPAPVPPPPPPPPPPGDYRGFTFAIEWQDFALRVIIPDAESYPVPDLVNPLAISYGNITLPAVSPSGAGYPISLPSWPSDVGLTEGSSNGVVVDTFADGEVLVIMGVTTTRQYEHFPNDGIAVQVNFLATADSDQVFYVNRVDGVNSSTFTFEVRDSELTTRSYTVYVPTPGSEDSVSIQRISPTPPPPPPPAPTASFTANPVTGEAPLFVNFTDTSTDGPTSWQWDFTNNGSTDSTSQNPSGVEYATPGVYSVKLTATNEFGSDENIRVDYIEVVAPPPPPPGGSAEVDVVTSLLNYQTAYTNTLRDLSGNPLDNAVEIGTLVLDESQANVAITGEYLNFTGLGSVRCSPPVDVTSTSYCFEFYLYAPPAAGLRLGVWSGGMFPFQPDEGNGGFGGAAATTIAPNGDWQGYSGSGSTGVTFGDGDVIGVLITNLYGVVWFKNGVRMNLDYADYLNGNDLTPLASMTE
jgi:PKD repeat protein